MFTSVSCFQILPAWIVSQGKLASTKQQCISSSWIWMILKQRCFDTIKVVLKYNSSRQLPPWSKQRARLEAKNATSWPDGIPEGASVMPPLVPSHPSRNMGKWENYETCNFFFLLWSIQWSKLCRASEASSFNDRQCTVMHCINALRYITPDILQRKWHALGRHWY